MLHKKRVWSQTARRERFNQKYMSKTQASRLLQTTTHGFQRLCILKGIYPRALTLKHQSKSTGNQRVYYLTRDIKWLRRDQIRIRINAFYSHQRKERKAFSLKRLCELTHFTQIRPDYRNALVSTIKERYPFFSDALEDVDDAMSLISLFAHLSPEIHSKTTVEFHFALPTGLHQRSRDVLKGWLQYVARTGTLRRAFISIKGFYYEALVQSQPILWIMPHEFSYNIPPNVEQQVMLSFLEVSVTMMEHVLFKLNKDMTESMQDTWDKKAESLIVTDLQPEPLEKNLFSPIALTNQQSRRHGSSSSSSSSIPELFKGFVFALSREVPWNHCQFLIESCGGVSKPLDQLSGDEFSVITHIVSDRPLLLRQFTVESLQHVEIIQPQYLWDCLNTQTLLLPFEYHIGRTLPAHHSPFTTERMMMKEEMDGEKTREKTTETREKTTEPREKTTETREKTTETREKTTEPREKMEEDHTAIHSTQKGDKDSQAIHWFEFSDDEESLCDRDHWELTQEGRERHWEDEEIRDKPKRTSISARRVREQRNLNSFNQPTSRETAERKLRRLKDSSEKTKPEEKTKDNPLETLLRLQAGGSRRVTRLYHSLRRQDEAKTKAMQTLKKKAKQLAKGKARIVTKDEGNDTEGQRKGLTKTFVTTREEEKRQRLTKDASKMNTANRNALRHKTNPYRHLPKWTR